MSTEVKIITGDTFKTIRSAVNQMVDFVKPTYGPASNKVIISKVLDSRIVDDGVYIARLFELNDPAENAVVKVIKEVAVRTNDRVGDGTTSSLIMLQAIIEEVGRKSRFDGRKVELELKKALPEVKAQLQASAKEIKTKAELKKVARVSFDDEKASEMISDLYFKLGKDGVITLDKSPTLETTSTLTEGINLGNGYISPYMITNPERMEAVLEKPYVLITDYRVTEATDILPIMEIMAKANKRELVIIAENVEGSALATAIINRAQGKFFTLAINAPSGTDRTVALEDLALMLGARLFTQAKGDKLEDAKLEDLGRAERIICKEKESTIVGPKGKKADVAMSITQLRAAFENEQDQYNKKKLETRLARFTNKVAVIKVGAPTENEQKTLKEKYEDAVNAVRAAYKGGVVRGAGLALAGLVTSSPILNEALKYPARQLRENMGIDGEPEFAKDKALNVVTGETGNFMEVGVMDPVEVLIAGVESAVSIASILLTSSGMIVETPKKVPIQEG